MKTTKLVEQIMLEPYFAMANVANNTIVCNIREIIKQDQKENGLDKEFSFVYTDPWEVQCASKDYLYEIHADKQENGTEFIIVRNVYETTKED